MKINKLTISNFAGIKEEKFNFDGKDAKIYGNNATGKTTTANRITMAAFR
ncbi:phiPVL ORF41-like protein [Staphylococcus aureus]|nr:phiPVL ORF41-like protein [Staphylococcus aureus]